MMISLFACQFANYKKQIVIQYYENFLISNDKCTCSCSKCLILSGYKKYLILYVISNSEIQDQRI